MVYLCLLENNISVEHLPYTFEKSVIISLSYVCVFTNVSRAPCALNIISCLSLSALYRVFWIYSAEWLLSVLSEKRYFLTLAQVSEGDNTIGRYCYLPFGTKQDSGKEYTEE